MKTIAFNRSRGSWLTTVLVLGGLVGLYYYRSQGGKFSKLFSGAFTGIGAIRDRLGDMVGGSDESMSENVGESPLRRNAREIATSPESLDSIPAK